MSESWTTLRVLEWTTERFDRAGIDSPRLDAQILLAHALSCDRMQLYTSYDRPLGPEELSAYRALIRRRLAGQPVAYLIGEQEFWSLPFYVDASVLIPRPDTETVIQVVLEELDAELDSQLDAELDVEAPGVGESLENALPENGQPSQGHGATATADGGGELVYELDEPELELYDEVIGDDSEAAPDPPEEPPVGGRRRRAEKPARLARLRIADIATGSGAIAVTLAHELRNSEVVASDLSEDAARLARRNADRNGVADRVTVRTGDLFAGFAAEDRAQLFDIVVSNPPYIPSAVMSGLSAEVRSEPHMALDGGADGLVIVRRLIAGARAHLRPGGLLVLEHGYDQADAVAALFADNGAYEAVRCRRDLGGNPRVSYARTRG